MLKLKKLYSLINRNATIKLVNEKHTDVYFCGTVKDIPDQYDLWKVVDLFELNSYEYEIMITEKQENTIFKPP